MAHLNHPTLHHDTHSTQRTPHHQRVDDTDDGDDSREPDSMDLTQSSASHSHHHHHRHHVHSAHSHTLSRGTTSCPQLDAMTPAQVRAWLRSHHLDVFVPVFERNQIAGHDLVDLTHSDLISMGVYVCAQRKSLLRTIQGVIMASHASTA